MLKAQQNELDFLLESLDHLDFEKEDFAKLSKRLAETFKDLSDLEKDSLSLTASGSSVSDVACALRKLWEEFNDMSSPQQARRRLVIGALSANELLDTHTGAYLARFALGAGLDIGKVTCIFSDFLNRLKV